jgi:hypothetical protein
LWFFLCRFSSYLFVSLISFTVLPAAVEGGPEVEVELEVEVEVEVEVKAGAKWNWNSKSRWK